MTKKKLILVDKICKKSALEGENAILFWRSDIFEQDQTGVSISSLFERNPEQLRGTFLKWIFEVSKFDINQEPVYSYFTLRENLNYWWMSLIHEKCNFSKSPRLELIIKFIALEIYCTKNEIKEISLISDDALLYEAIVLFCSDLEIDLCIEKRPRRVFQFFRNVFQRFLEVNVSIKGLAVFFNLVLEAFPLRGIGVTGWKESRGLDIFISYFVNLDIKMAENGHFRSGYWQGLPEEFEARSRRVNWLHIIENHDGIPNSRIAANLLRKLNTGNLNIHRHVALTSFVSFKVIFKTLSSWFQIRRKAKKIEKEFFDCIPSKHLGFLLREDWCVSMYGYVGIKNIFHTYLFSEALSSIPRQKQGVFLMENQGWEMGLIQIWKMYGHGKISGFAHSTVRFWDLRYFFDPRYFSPDEIGAGPLPDAVLCSGVVSESMLVESGYPKSLIHQVEALRYMKKYGYQDTNHVTKDSAQTILLVGDYDEKHTNFMLKIVSEYISSGRGLNFTFVFKPHPLADVNLSECFFHEGEVVVDKSELVSLLKSADIVLVGPMTSAVIDAMIWKKSVITIVDKNRLNLSPLYKYQESEFVSSPDELELTLNKVSMNGDLPKGIGMYFNLSDRLQHWKQFLFEKI